MGEPETHFRDPMAALMDLCSSLRPGENLWYQILLIPIGFDWADELDKEVSKILGEKPKFKKNALHYGADAAMGAINGLHNILMGAVESESKSPEKKDDALKMMNLKPKQKKRVEGIEKKSGKVAFNFKIRFVYLAEKEVYNKAKVFGGFVGYMKQFNAVDSNGLKPDMDKTVTSASYLFRLSNLNGKKNRIFHNYINRDTHAGRKRGLLNVEELATIWHFPNEAVVKAPMIQKAPGRKSEPPMTLPQSEAIISDEKIEPLFLGDLQEESGFVETAADELSTESSPVAPSENAEGESVFVTADEEKSIAENSGSFQAKETLNESRPSFANATEDKGLPPENLPFV
jgi:hypothetical protein